MMSQDGHGHERPRRWGRVRPDGQAAMGGQRLLQRWPVRLFFLSCLLAAAIAWPLACATVVMPPSDPPDPVQVYLLDHGRTSSLVLPTADGNLMRYVYGNWEWYVMMHTGVCSGLRALCWSSPAALGRRAYPGPPEPAQARRLFEDWSQHFFAITVSRPQALRLAAALDQRFRRSISTLHINTAYELDFVRDPHPYHLFHDSNHEVAEWLEALGCRIHGPAIMANWKVTSGDSGNF